MTLLTCCIIIMCCRVSQGVHAGAASHQDWSRHIQPQDDAQGPLRQPARPGLWVLDWGQEEAQTLPSQTKGQRREGEVHHRRSEVLERWWRGAVKFNNICSLCLWHSGHKQIYLFNMFLNHVSHSCDHLFSTNHEVWWPVEICTDVKMNVKQIQQKHPKQRALTQAVLSTDRNCVDHQSYCLLNHSQVPASPVFFTSV